MAHWETVIPGREWVRPTSDRTEVGRVWKKDGDINAVIDNQTYNHFEDVEDAQMFVVLETGS